MQMNNGKKVVGLAVLLFAWAACSQPAAPQVERTREEGAREVQVRPRETEDASKASVSFVNKVWRVTEPSDIAPGALYVFLSDGTLVMSSPNGKPAFGTWKDEGGALTMIEEGLPYKTDILKLSKDEFRIRSHNPGKPVEITLVAAEGATPPK